MAEENQEIEEKAGTGIELPLILGAAALLAAPSIGLGGVLRLARSKTLLAGIAIGTVIKRDNKIGIYVK